MESQEPHKKNWRGFLLNQFPTIMERAADYMKRPKGAGVNARFMALNAAASPVIAVEPDPILILAVREALEDFDPVALAVIEFVFIREMCLEDVAESLDLDIRVIRKIVKRTKAVLKSRLKDWA